MWRQSRCYRSELAAVPLLLSKLKPRLAVNHCNDTLGSIENASEGQEPKTRCNCVYRTPQFEHRHLPFVFEITLQRV